VKNTSSTASLTPDRDRLTGEPSNACREAGGDREARKKSLLEPSKSDGGELVGKDPRKLSPESFSLWFRAKSPLKAIRARCLDCCCDQASEVRKCASVDCPSWPFRMGTNPFREKRVLTDEQKAEMTERLRRECDGRAAFRSTRKTEEGGR